MLKGVAGLFLVVLFFASPGRAQRSTDALKNLFVDFGVPSTPALVFLPSAPSSVTHVTTPKDLQAQTMALFQGAHLQTGAAFDARLFGLIPSSLREYQGSFLKQALLRTVASLGTAPAGKDSKDVILGFGARIPVIDRADPRADSSYTNTLERRYADAFAKVKPPSVADLTGPNAAQVIAAYNDRALRAGEQAVDSVRQVFRRDRWNALRTDIGFAVTMAAPGGSIKPDTLVRNRLGGWVAVGFPLTRVAQGTVSASEWWARADSAAAETARRWIGAAARVFLGDALAVRAEGSHTWSRYRETPVLDDQWDHVAVGVEVKVPLLGGWLDIAYGGETAHRGVMAAGLSLQYAVFQNRQVAR